jgi:glycosyltransferase involved in cell wall biosynthesis
MNKLPLVSIIITTYNREKYIGVCMNALTKQDYPRDRYEIIVVDDGSVDKTSDVVLKYPVKLIRHEKNLGIPYGRNTGLKNAKGEIIAITDDDCIADKKWLKNLIEPYKNTEIIGVGGIVLPYSCNHITEKYMFETGYGNPAPIDFGKSKNPLYRFLIYLKDMFKPVAMQGGIIQVQNIYTGNASFRKKDLEHIGGFDEKLKTSEDTDVCTRLNMKFRNKKIVFTNKSIILHKHHTSFFCFLKQTFMRSTKTLQHYLKHNKIPPVFPFPMFTLLLTFIVVYFNLFLGLLTLVILPQILYLWWLVKFFKRHKFYYLLFPYMQFSLELATIFGMFRGFIDLELEKLK